MEKSVINADGPITLRPVWGTFEVTSPKTFPQ